ncbi:MAG TPA: hypothetical protein VFS20_01655 [Longimicrobium sp.]|nr:hypothetical protein [Longimicrobium sp.]
MPTIERTLKTLQRCFQEIQADEASLQALRPESFFDEERYDRRKQDIENHIRAVRQEMIEALNRYEREPERFVRHFASLPKLHEKGNFDNSVFIMTKFPSGNDQRAMELDRVIETVKAGVRHRNFVPRLASEANVQRWLWDNVELFLLGCGRGIAIVEDRYTPELNPNVAMEWGWMTGMGRPVLFLRERNFQHERADWSGLLNETFDWDDPAPGIEHALDRFLLP